MIIGGNFFSGGGFVFWLSDSLCCFMSFFFFCLFVGEVEGYCFRVGGLCRCVICKVVEGMYSNGGGGGEYEVDFMGCNNGGGGRMVLFLLL